MILIEATDHDFAALMLGEAPREYILPAGGLERPEVLKMLRGLAADIRLSFEPASWLMIESGEVVGLCSLVKKPSGGGIDIGYGVAAARRHRGLASAATGALIEWARRDYRVQIVRAETSVDNLPSQRVLERNGFARAGERIDEEDGRVFCWSIEVGE